VSASSPNLKSELLAAVIRALREEMARQAGAAESSREEAISEESRPENKWDTHSQEAAYLAEGQARLAAEISGALNLYQGLHLRSFGPDEPVALGALVGVAAAEGASVNWYFLGPHGGGLEVELAGRKILVVTPGSPLGRQLVGSRRGETVRLPGKIAGGSLTIISIG
jgi:transcription elongation GreA/GreB family factor